MVKTYDTVIVLAHHLDQNGAMTIQTKERLDQAITYYHYSPEQERNSKSITVSGGKSPYCPKTHAQVMAEYAQTQHVSRLHLEALSLDTVGQAVFTKKVVVKPNNYGSVLVVTHDYHMNRVQAIFRAIYGTEFALGFARVTDSTDPQLKSIVAKDRLQREETEKRLTFEIMFGQIRIGDDESYLERMLAEHPLYKL